mgnify:CR=1 FL=1
MPNCVDSIGFIVVVLGIVLTMWILFGETPEKPKPKPKDDPPKERQRELAIQMLKGDKSPEQIEEEYGYDIEHIKQWKMDFIKEAQDDRRLRDALGID